MDGFRHVSTGGGCTALVRRFAVRVSDDSDAGAIAITADDDDPRAPTDLDAPCVVGVYGPDAFADGCSDTTRIAPSAREAIAWGREQTSVHEALARLPAHWAE